jgi:hypothetical protein
LLIDLYFTPFSDVCLTVRRPGTILAANFVIYLIKDKNCLFYRKAGEKNIIPEYFLGFFNASLKQIAPPILCPEIKILRFLANN